MRSNDTPWIVLLAVGLVAGCTLDSAGGGAASASSGADTTTPGSTDVASAGTDSVSGAASATTTPDDSTFGPTEASGSTEAVSGPSSVTTDTTGSTTDDATMSGGSTGDGRPMLWCDPAWPGLAACYTFDNLAGGVLVDESPAGNDGTVAGVGIEAGPLGEAASFSDDSEISVPDHPATDFADQMTLELFVRIDDVPASGRAGILDRDGQYSVFLFSDGRIRCGGSGNQTYWDDVITGQWLHIGCVAANDLVRLYVNGQLVSESAYGNSLNTGNTNPLAVGDNSPGFEEPLSGAISGLRMWSVPRSEAELCEGAGSLCP